ncbi:MAG: uracil-DNA glycosylase family protein, partial [Myxococcales bacterium]|nr:uracil-DNA glycosylase family protein [Myxococcales bacterium]
MSFDDLLAEVRGCTLCAAALPHAPRPVVRLSPRSRVLVIGQAPGSKVHASGRPWDDDSGARLVDWLGVDRTTCDDPDALGI